MQKNNHITAFSVIATVFAVSSAYLYYAFFVPTKHFPKSKQFTVNENESLKTISERLFREGFISSPLLFRAGVSFLNKDTSVQLGGYVFDREMSLLQVIHSLTSGNERLPLLSVTIPEGSTSYEVASIIVKAFPSFSQEVLQRLIEQYHAKGKLFPSTYYLLPSYKEEDVIKLMLTTFSKKAEKEISETNVASPLTSLDDVLTLASILEGEAKTEKDMKIVSGILLKRLTLGMPLQVDVAKETYKERGLPKEPLNNPGLVAIRAVLFPTATEYLYYITGKDGQMYYAKTFEEHKKNIQKYLR